MVSQSLNNRPSLKAFNTCRFAFISQFQYNKQYFWISVHCSYCVWMIARLAWHFCTRKKLPNQKDITSLDHSNVSKESNQDSILKWKRHMFLTRMVSIRKYCDEDSSHKTLAPVNSMKKNPLTKLNMSGF